MTLSLVTDNGKERAVAVMDQEATTAVTAEAMDDQGDEGENLWDVRRAARFLAKSSSWVYREAEARRLPHRKIGRTLRFIPAELRAWVEKQPGQVV
ncbi:MAG: helix-turn-helix domain-containing protein [Myxococcales bacterium]